MIWGTLAFLFKERSDLSAYWERHGANLSAALRDALPLIERYRSRVAPTSDAVMRLEAVARRATEPEFSPTNPNRDAG